MVTSSIARIPMPRWYVLGTDGALVKEGLDPQEPGHGGRRHRLGARGGPRQLAAPVPPPGRPPVEEVLEPVAGRWRSYYENVAAAIRGREEPAVTPESVRAVMGVIDAARESARCGRAVEIPAS